MCVFKQHHFGKLLDKNISDFLLEYTSIADVNKAAKKIKSSSSILRQVRTRFTPMSEKSSKGIAILMRMAVDNCGNIQAKAEKDKVELQKIIHNELVY
jgi:hypothetical protein